MKSSSQGPPVKLKSQDSVLRNVAPEPVIIAVQYCPQGEHGGVCARHTEQKSIPDGYNPHLPAFSFIKVAPDLAGPDSAPSRGSVSWYSSPATLPPFPPASLHPQSPEVLHLWHQQQVQQGRRRGTRCAWRQGARKPHCQEQNQSPTPDILQEKDGGGDRQTDKVGNHTGREQRQIIQKRDLLSPCPPVNTSNSLSSLGLRTRWGNRKIFFFYEVY